jgi:hypothetical protein
LKNPGAIVILFLVLFLILLKKSRKRTRKRKRRPIEFSNTLLDPRPNARSLPPPSTSGLTSLRALRKMRFDESSAGSARCRL